MYVVRDVGVLTRARMTRSCMQTRAHLHAAAVKHTVTHHLPFLLAQKQTHTTHLQLIALPAVMQRGLYQD